VGWLEKSTKAFRLCFLGFRAKTFSCSCKSLETDEYNSIYPYANDKIFKRSRLGRSHGTQLIMESITLF
jgi:hypothetical protein